MATSPKPGYLHLAALRTSVVSEPGHLVEEICCGLGLLWEEFAVVLGCRGIKEKKDLHPLSASFSLS